VNGSIIDLRETSPQRWQAKYQGNYGIYTIKITTDGERTEHFSCSCPSSGYPCKHIGIIEDAIAERIAKYAKNEKAGGGREISAGKLLKKLSHEELYNFTARMVQNNPDLSNAVLLEFADRIETSGDNKYAPIIRRGLAEVCFDEEDYYDEMGPQIDILDQWFQKAWRCLKEKNFQEAILISKACIEEYAVWLDGPDDERSDYLDERYRSEPFEILEEAAANDEINARELYDYCMAEMQKKKYSSWYMFDGFNSVLMRLSARVDPGGFIALQYQLLEKIEDKSSYRAEKILSRIVDLYTELHQRKKAWQCVEDNIQIGSFRAKVVEKRIAQKDFAGAKKLIRDCLDRKRAEGNTRPGKWDDYLLRIARQEQDRQAVRELSFSFIKDRFEKEYFLIYRSSFDDAEWPEEFEKLFLLYEHKKSLWSSPAADLLAAEGMAERLMEYVGKRLSLETLEKYYAHFVSAFPAETLALFRRALDSYAEQNTGRSYYEYIVAVFKKMKKIPGGAAVVGDMKTRYRLTYKNRRAMMEVLNRK
jgi:hypothetical protein